MKLKYFSLASKIAKQSDHPHHRMGAVAVLKDRTIVAACNLMKTHPKSPHPWKRLHAETRVALAAKTLKGADVYIFRATKDGKLALAKPCISCYNFLCTSGVKNIYYTIKDGYKQCTV